MYSYIKYLLNLRMHVFAKRIHCTVAASSSSWCEAPPIWIFSVICEASFIKLTPGMGSLNAHRVRIALRALRARIALRQESGQGAGGAVQPRGGGGGQGQEGAGPALGDHTQLQSHWWWGALPTLLVQTLWLLSFVKVVKCFLLLTDLSIEFLQSTKIEIKDSIDRFRHLRAARILASSSSLTPLQLDEMTSTFCSTLPLILSRFSLKS